MSATKSQQLLLLWLFLSSSMLAGRVFGQWEGREELLTAVEKTFGNPADSKRLTPKERVWINREKHRLIVDGYIALQEGQLELFACPVFTKEHESVVALFSKAVTIHAGLLAVGAEVGKPVKWDPEYAAPTGSEIQIQAYWKDENDKPQSIDARKWVRDLSGKDKALELNWVFAGSGFWEDPDTKKRLYNAEAGDLICVSNFSTATLDIPVKSTQANSGLMFVAYTANIPKQGTPVRLVLQVVQPKEKTEKAATGEADTTNANATPPALEKPKEPSADQPSAEQSKSQPATESKPNKS